MIDQLQHCPRPGTLDERKLSAWVVLSALVLFSALSAPFFLGRVFVADDLGEFHLPLRDFYSRQLEHGEPFDWMPSLYGGFYVSAEGQLGAYHPWHWLLYRGLPLGAAFDIELLASYPLMFLGTFLLLVRLVGRRDAAWFGALVFTFCGFNLLHFVHPNAVAIVAHIPWLLWAIDVALASASRRARALAEAGIALLTASQLLLGYPQYVWLSLLVEMAFAAWRAVSLRSDWTRVAMLVAAKSLGVLIGAVQWIPTLHLLNESVRQSADADFANLGSLHPLNLLQLIAPYLFQTRVVGQNTHELGWYVGAVPVLLCIWLFTQRSQLGKLKPLAQAALVSGVAAFLLACGEYGGLYRLQAFVPLANRFRFPCRSIVLVELSIAVGATIALRLLTEPRRRWNDEQQTTGDRAMAVVLITSLALAVIGPLAWPQFVAGPALVWCGPALVAIGWWLVAMAERGRRWAPVALVLFAATDLGAYGLSYSTLGTSADLHAYVGGISRPPGAVAVRVGAANSADGFRAGDRMLLAGLDRVDGYAGLEPRKVLDYTRPDSLRLAGAKWYWQEDAARDARVWVPIEPTAPRARLVTQVVPRPKLGELGSLGDDQVWCDEPLELSAGEPGTAQVVEDGPGRLAMDVSAATRQLLVTTESYDSSWQASTGNDRRPVLRVNGDFLGCLVELGDRQITFEFRPASLWYGKLVTACGLQLMVCLLVVRLLPRHTIRRIFKRSSQREAFA